MGLPSLLIGATGFWWAQFASSRATNMVAKQRAWMRKIIMAGRLGRAELRGFFQKSNPQQWFSTIAL
jgi:hypothetical protein